jgi:dTMP kinase
LYALDRWESKDFILKKINEGRIVVCDRYVSANMIHQGGKVRQKDKREELMEWLEEMEFDILKVPKPDLVIYLDVPYDMGQKLVDKKSRRKYVGGKRRDIHEMNSNHLKNAQLQARELVKKNKKWMRIDCVDGSRLLSPEEISDLIWSKVRKHI